jgi:hypothetical protein
MTIDEERFKTFVMIRKRVFGVKFLFRAYKGA